MQDVSVFVGIDVSKAKLDVAVGQTAAVFTVDAAAVRRACGWP